MRFDKIIYLIDTTTSENDIGDSIDVPVKRKILAAKNSIRQSEFYQAEVTDLRPEISFTTWTIQYNGESRLEFEAKTYTIIRTFEKADKTIELVCQGLVNG